MKSLSADPDGILLVDKAEGMTSHDVVALTRRKLGTKKIGHCGTLDPIATGLLLLTIGRGTKVQDLLMSEDKEYVGTFVLGVTTDTQDREGEIILQRLVPALDEQQIRAAFEQFRGDSSLSTWLSRIAMNEALGRLRRQRPGVELSSLPQGALEAQIIQFPLAASEDPEKSMAQREIQHVVEHAIDELPEPFRLVFITRVIEGMNLEETAELLGLKPETVKTRLHRARRLLKDEMEKHVGPVMGDAFPFAGRRCERLRETVLARLNFS